MTASDKEHPELVIRPMKRSDINAIALIETRIFPDPWPTAAFEEELQSEFGGVIVAASGETIIGYAVYMMAAGEAHLTNIGTAPEFHRKGVARQLLTRILEIAKDGECDYIFLDVRPSNTAAIGLYEEFGFIELYRRRNYYNIPPEDALVMVKNLNEEAD